MLRRTATFDLERPLLQARTIANLCAALAHGAMELCAAQGVVIYVVDATGQKLRPLASEGTYPTQRLATLGLGWDRQQSPVLAALQNAATFAQDVRGTGEPEILRKQLFASRGWLLAMRLDACSPNTEPTALRAGTGVALFNLMAPAAKDQELERETLCELFETFLQLRPLVDAFEHKDDHANRNQDKQDAAWERLNAALSERLVGISAQVSQMRSQIARYAIRDYCILVQGETGTGKELAARALHRLSTRSKGTWVAENCSALPENLIEGELFGYEKGAFTGADESREGLMSKASGGTLFLDEIGDLPLSLQAKLLRVLQERKVRPLGAREERDVDFRLVTATHKDLRKAVEEGTFRADLYHRIAQLTLKLPPLRDRVGDISYLAEYFLSEMAARENQPLKTLSDGAMALLEAHPFTGNIRELQNCMIRAALVAGEATSISDNHIRDVLQSIAIGSSSAPRSSASSSLDVNLCEEGLPETMARVERALLEQCHDRFSGNRLKMAGYLKIPRRTLANKLARHEIGTSSADALPAESEG
ncbi:sigma-54 dependent transcriptional regulator [Roseibium sp. TrichSKD4]|uniref:sigma-54 interaction domain-containing protein n=1 Tax=Roseibium sp. TrichSKD4 TaxID=744980 RepID=UPI0001E56E4C|nr:sigma-54 dependent transcriptional regulator [Roseibium sp. TrichSKD4]EFO30318.1 sigma-54 dependent transcriptional regulator [Roseibium sp. TrichSKD4]